MLQHLDPKQERSALGILVRGEVGARRVAEAVEAELAAMKPELAEVFRWRTRSDLSFKDIAARQGTSVNTALGRMHQATRKVAKALADAGLTREE